MCKKPAAKRSPAPVKSTILRPSFIPHSTTSFPFTATAPFSPLVKTIILPKDFEKLITSSKDFASINEIISCSFAKVISNLFLTNSKNGVCVDQHKTDLIKTSQLYLHFE